MICDSKYHFGDELTENDFNTSFVEFKKKNRKDRQYEFWVDMKIDGFIDKILVMTSEDKRPPAASLGMNSK